MIEDSQNCVFCFFSSDEKVRVWENALFFAMYDSFPVSPGHTLIIPKRHVVNFEELTMEEWSGLKDAAKTMIARNEGTDFKKVYTEMLNIQKSEISKWFLIKTLENTNINTKPQAYNFGINDGRAAGRTVDHFHWHIIPRYDGDIKDPRGGVRYVIPDLGNYKIPRS